MQRRLLAALIVAPLLFGGCAMKGDIRDLQAEIGEMQARQERLLLEIQRQNSAILDSLQIQDVRLRGDFTNQLVQIERQLVQVQELTGQGQQRLAELRETLQAREEALRRAEAAAANPDLGDPEDLFTSAEAALERGSTATARAGFQEFISAFPQHARTPAARLYLGAILADADELGPALQEYNRIWELHPDDPEAATALFRAAEIERDRNNNERARALFNSLTAAYPSSPEAAQAREQLRRMR